MPEFRAPKSGLNEVVRPIGAGGTGEVYLALQQDHCTLLQQKMWRCGADFCRATSPEKNSEV